MRSAALAFLSAATVNGLAIRNGCQLKLSANGNIMGTVGEISSGQVRAGSGVSATTFTIDGDTIVDDKGRGCWWTPPTKVLQCDQGQAPDHGFKIGCDGSVSFNGQTTFYECATSEDGQYNLYLTPDQGVKCGEVTLTSDGCHGDCTNPGSGSCPTDLNGAYEFPHLIIPVDKAQPDTALGTSYYGQISKTKSTIFNFDIPAEDDGKRCSLIFLFPKQEDLQTSHYEFSGDGKLQISKLSAVATNSTTYNNQPAKQKDVGAVTISPGHSYNIFSFECPGAETLSFEATPTGDTHLYYFQDYNPSPIGMYVRKC